jgi:hypothetical protein
MGAIGRGLHPKIVVAKKDEPPYTLDTLEDSNPYTPHCKAINSKKSAWAKGKMLSACSWLYVVENSIMVELLGRYSNWISWTDRLQELGETRRRPDGETVTRGVARRLRPDEVAQLAAKYQEGATVNDLAERFKIHRTTVSAHLHLHGAQMRNRGMTEQQTVEAARLYRQGWSLARIGARFGVDGSTVWRDLRQLGVPMRKPYERGLGPVGS